MGEALHGLRVALLSAVVGAEVSAISAWEMALICSPRGKS